MNIVDIYSKFYKDDVSNQEKFKTLRRKNLIRLSNKCDVETQTNHNTILDTISYTKHRQHQSPNHTYIEHKVKIEHDNSIVNDSVHENYGVLNDLLVKQNIYVGNVLLTPGTQKIEVNANNLNLCFNGNFLLNINTQSVQIDAHSIEYRHHGTIIFNNRLNRDLTLTFSEKFSQQTLKLNSLQQIQMHYMTYNNKVIFRKHATEKKNDVDLNDLKNIFNKHISKISISNLDIPNSVLLSSLSTSLSLNEIKNDSQILIESPNKHLTLYSNNAILDLSDVNIKHIHCKITNPNILTIFIKPFGKTKNLEEGSLTLESNVKTSVVFIRGFMKDPSQEYNITQNNPLKLWYNHITHLNTIIRIRN